MNYSGSIVKPPANTKDPSANGAGAPSDRSLYMCNIILFPRFRQTLSEEEVLQLSEAEGNQRIEIALSRDHLVGDD